MSNGSPFNLYPEPTPLADLQEAFRVIAQKRQGDALALLEVLRSLEALHREIREDLFQKSLPDNRQALYNLLRQIESDGGWPYISRMKLRSLLANLSDLALEPPLVEVLPEQPPGDLSAEVQEVPKTE